MSDMRDRIARAVSEKRTVVSEQLYPSDYALADAVIAALPELQGWQPIETAPRDEMSFMIYIPSKKFPVKQGFWERDHFRWYGCNSITAAKHHQPTHWMPLPTPPQEASHE